MTPPDLQRTGFAWAGKPILPLILAGYLNFKVVSANRANTSETIQKRTMIFDSDQPINSK
jgi:hypothetical protein